MGEELLKAILELFAIVAREDGFHEEERNTIHEFLQENLNEDTIPQYISFVDGYLKAGLESDRGHDGIEQIDRNSQQLNQELTHQQKLVLMLKMIELIYADGSMSEREAELVNHIGQSIRIIPGDVELIKVFVAQASVYELDIREFLIVAGEEKSGLLQSKQMLHPGLSGELAFVNIPESETYFVKYLGDQTLYLNGIPLKPGRASVFSTGSTIRSQRIQPLYYSDVISHFIKIEDDTQISFQANKISYAFSNGKLGLRGIDVSEESGTLVGIMGGSGSGKSTLLNVLNGNEKPSSGRILINGVDINQDKKAVQGVIGYVPQDDLLMEDLTVFENLFYAAKLCFGDSSQTEIEKLVVQTLKNLGLTEIKDLKVGSPLKKTISGGQRKRVNIGLELLREPSVLFVDEPTSGLSSRDSENIMDLLKELSLKGKLIFVVIHQPSSDIFKMFDKLIILDVGGYQIYYGNPVEAEFYFNQRVNLLEKDSGTCIECGNIRPEQVFNIIETKVVNEYGRLTDDRKISPSRWNKFFMSHGSVPEVGTVTTAPKVTLNIPSKINQLRIFTMRDVLSKLSNQQYLLINLLEPPLLAFILAFIIRYFPTIEVDSKEYLFSKNINIPAYFFISIIVALFMGLMISAEEIIKDRKILKRESFLHLSRSSYLLSKILIMFGFSAIQTFMFVLIGDYILEIDGMNITYWMILFTTSCFANILGLNVSASFNSAITIYILIPLLIIPQLMLSGVVVRFDKLNPILTSQQNVPLIGDIMASRWTFEASMVSQFKENDFERLFYRYDRIMANSDYKNIYYLPLIASRLDYCLHNRDSDDPKIRKRLKYNLELIGSELSKELKAVGKSDFPHEASFSIVKFDSSVYYATVRLINTLNQFYVNKFKTANKEKEELMDQMNATPDLRVEFDKLRSGYQNEGIVAFVKNTNDTHRIVEENGRLIRKIFPIYMDPDPSLNPVDYRAPLFSPQKIFLGYTWDTLVFNLLAIWVMSLVLVVTLYLETFRKMGNLFGRSLN